MFEILDFFYFFIFIRRGRRRRREKRYIDNCGDAADFSNVSR